MERRKVPKSESRIARRRDRLYRRRRKTTRKKRTARPIRLPATTPTIFPADKLEVGAPLRGGALVVDTGLFIVRVPYFNELVGVIWFVFKMGLGRVVCWGTEEVDRLVEEVVLELMAVEEVFNLEVEDEAEVELEVVGVVEVVEAVEESTAELEDSTEEGVLDSTGTLDDGEEESDETGDGEVNESVACELVGAITGTGTGSEPALPPFLSLPPPPCRAKMPCRAGLR
jgi:hypothetical protein